jgi:YD repeat-containing protein
MWRKRCSIGVWTGITGAEPTRWRQALADAPDGVAQTIDGITGETVSYTYDAVNRLATAQTADGSWGDAYTCDGWGNLTQKTVTKGSAPPTARRSTRR